MLTLIFAAVGACGLWVWQAKRQYALNRQLIAALVHNDSKQALTLVNMGADPNTRYAPPPSPTLKLLLNQLLLHRSSVPADDSSTAFMFVCSAAWYGAGNHIRISFNSPEDIPLVRAMLIHGADCKATASQQNWSALHCAVWKGRPQTVQLLLEHGANINQQDILGMTPLMQSVMPNRGDMTRLLLDHGASVSIETRSGDSALHMAVWYEIDKSIIRQLLAHGANPNLADKKGETPLLLAQKQSHSDIVKLLWRKR